MKLRVQLLYFFMLATQVHAYTQQPEIRFTNLSTKDGLLSNVVYDLHQDRQGFMWIATHNGLSRYDGHHFRHYQYDPGNSNSISGNYVHCIKEDKNGILWLATNKGLNSLNPFTGSIRRYKMPAKEMSADMEQIFVVNDSVLLITAVSTMYRFNKNTLIFTEFTLPHFANPFTLLQSKFIADHKGNIFINRGDGNNDCLSINWQNAVAVLVPLLDVLHIPQSKYYLSNFYFDAQNNPWCFSTAEALMLTKKISGTEIHYPFTNPDVHAPENVVKSFYEEPGKRLWICTDAGLVFYDYIQNKFYRYTQKAGDKESLSNNRVNCMMRDKNGLYWTGTFGGGICYFSINAKFKHVNIDTGYNSGDRIIYGLKTLSSGRILITTSAAKKFILDKNKKLFELKNPKDSISVDSMIYEITGQKRKEFSEKNYGLLYMVCNAWDYQQRKKPYVPVKDIPDGGVFINSGNEVWVYKNMQFISADTAINFKHSIMHAMAMTDNNFLLSTNNGLVVFDTKTKSIKKTYLPERDNPYSIGSNLTGYILPDIKGNYWIGTQDAGLDFWDAKANRFYHYTKKDGLPDNKIYQILPDKYGRLWISTNNGLSCFDTIAKTFTNYTKTDGLINTEYNSGSACMDDEGTMYFGGMDGIDYFHPDSLTQLLQAPSLIAAAFKVYNQLQPINSSYDLATNDNNISIEFSANDFLNASKILYRYKLRGADKDWLTAQGVNNVQYNKLPSGSYRFSVQGSYNGKTWGTPLVIDFAIATPWFQSWWFFTLLVLFSVGVVWLLFQYRLQQRLKVLQVRNRIHRDLHDDVGSTLSSVKAYSEILKENPNKLMIADLIKENATEMIDRLEVIAWATNPQHDSFGSLLDKINRYAAPLCHTKNINYQITQHGISRETIIPGEIRQSLYLIAKEAINNTIKYSNAGNCSTEFRIESGKFVMQIMDDGKGFNTTMPTTGNGLQNMAARIKDIGGILTFNSDNGHGTTIKIQLPYPFKIPNSWDRKHNQR
ncbi:MAG TPA: two-component regulator propeller domain-containing protein [Panacibacter sp.]|nr:two-component regulator propeller domain-containing protein [Panacibacter sp.]